MYIFDSDFRCSRCEQCQSPGAESGEDKPGSAGVLHLVPRGPEGQGGSAAAAAARDPHAQSLHRGVPLLPSHGRRHPRANSAHGTTSCQKKVVPAPDLLKGIVMRSLRR